MKNGRSEVVSLATAAPTIAMTIGAPTMYDAYDAARRAAQERLYSALSPCDAGERRVVTWLCNWEPATLNAISDMVERAASEATDIRALI
jgi:hypothetical protein